MAYNADGITERMEAAGRLRDDAIADFNLDLDADMLDFVALQREEELRSRAERREARQIALYTDDEGSGFHVGFVRAD
ncbi:hypothetical protein HKD27_04130 [Gluconobacter sp. R75690]|uniref:hypothetical protein n=1 Tax=unclassified Gluconobacter TaxID=2644261 RepID=UPI00188B0C8A|nr:MULTISPECIES: hypothetical protein [unclassified Gluconobacter]MBF0850111.1 hypothetical protein [Gluconobacter sp. R75690]MBF0879054.1 hypothetical protein [Gluconobacter sp. R75828]